MRSQTNQPTLADLFAEARTLLEGKTVADVFVMRPDPAYDALRKVVEVQRYPISLIAEIYWEQAPDGALEGALKKALACFAPTFHNRLELTKELDFLGNTEGDTRIPAMQAVVKWLEGDA